MTSLIPPISTENSYVDFFYLVCHGSNVSSFNDQYPVELPYASISTITIPHTPLGDNTLQKFLLRPCQAITGVLQYSKEEDTVTGTSDIFLPPLLFSVGIGNTDSDRLRQQMGLWYGQVKSEGKANYDDADKLNDVQAIKNMILSDSTLFDVNLAQKLIATPPHGIDLTTLPDMKTLLASCKLYEQGDDVCVWKAGPTQIITNLQLQEAFGRRDDDGNLIQPRQLQDENGNLETNIDGTPKLENVYSAFFTYSQVFAMINSQCKKDGIDKSTISIGIFTCQDATIFPTEFNSLNTRAIVQTQKKKSPVKPAPMIGISNLIDHKDSYITLCTINLPSNDVKVQPWQTLASLTHQGCAVNVLAYYGLIEPTYARGLAVCAGNYDMSIYKIIDYIHEYNDKPQNIKYYINRFPIDAGIALIMAFMKNVTSTYPYACIIKIYDSIYYTKGSKRLVNHRGHVVSIYKDPTDESICLIDPQLADPEKKHYKGPFDGRFVFQLDVNGNIIIPSSNPSIPVKFSPIKEFYSYSKSAPGSLLPHSKRTISHIDIVWKVKSNTFSPTPSDQLKCWIDPTFNSYKIPYFTKLGLAIIDVDPLIRYGGKQYKTRRRINNVNRKTMNRYQKKSRNALKRTSKRSSKYVSKLSKKNKGR